MNIIKIIKTYLQNKNRFLSYKDYCKRKDAIENILFISQTTKASYKNLVKKEGLIKSSFNSLKGCLE